MAEKRYYWIKLKDTFMTSDTVDFLMGQKNGANYVVLYQMLCLKTVNTNGELARKIGEIIIPYDAEKIQRDCKYFDIDTIRVALELYKQLGLIYKQEDGILKIANFENMVGTSSNARVERFRENKKLIAERKIPNIEKHTNNKRYGGYYYTALQRDKHTCRICGSEDTIVMHHIVPYDANNDETVRLENLVSLCASCHGKLHKSRSRADLPPTAVLDDIGFDDTLMAIYNSLNECGSLCNVTSSVTVTGIEKDIDIRDKILDTRYKSIDSIDVNKSAHGRTRKEIINYIKERCDIELQEVICSRCYGNTEVLELVIDTIADILSSGESLSIKNNKINSEALYELVRGINNKQLSSIIQGFYQEKDGKWVRKQVSVPAKYIFTVLFNQNDINNLAEQYGKEE